MSEQLSDYKEKCKNHVYLELPHKKFMVICLLIGVVLAIYTIIYFPQLSWYVTFYPMAVVILGWSLFDLPRILWHDLVSCPDNKHWQYVERWQAKNDTKVTYEQQLRNEEIQIAQQKTKQETII